MKYRIAADAFLVSFLSLAPVDLFVVHLIPCTVSVKKPRLFPVLCFSGLGLAQGSIFSTAASTVKYPGEKSPAATDAVMRKGICISFTSSTLEQLTAAPVCMLVVLLFFLASEGRMVLALVFLLRIRRKCKAETQRQ